MLYFALLRFALLRSTLPTTASWNEASSYRELERFRRVNLIAMTTHPMTSSFEGLVISFCSPCALAPILATRALSNKLGLSVCSSRIAMLLCYSTTLLSPNCRWFYLVPPSDSELGQWQPLVLVVVGVWLKFWARIKINSNNFAGSFVS